MTDDKDLIWPGDPDYDDGSGNDEDNEADEREEEYTDGQRASDIKTLVESMSGQESVAMYIKLACKAIDVDPLSEAADYCVWKADKEVHQNLKDKYPKLYAAALAHDSELAEFCQV